MCVCVVVDDDVNVIVVVVVVFGTFGEYKAFYFSF